MLDQIAQTDRAAANLLHHCAGLTAGDRLVILHEPPGLGYYDDALPGSLAQSALALGLQVQLLQVPFAPDVRALAPGLATLIADADCAVFIARLGDQLRFQDMPAGARCVVVYALDGTMFRSGFGTAHYGAFLALKGAVDAALDVAREIRVTCPLGSDFYGPGPKVLRSGVTDVSILRFPMSVFSPVPAQAFSGCVALRFLAGTGSRYYQPGEVEFERPVIARFDAGRLTGFDGSGADVARAKAHYAHVAGLFGIDGGFVHSWHAGIHPGCVSTQHARADYDR
ncbi:MAG: hypothetical protein U1D06_10455, partial [Paracoccaceae bacterium]|nr:hypothetical protein [Paracoccaceae bacterium]